MNKNVHANHRKRVRQKIRDSGISGFEEHEILEFLLFYALPRRNTNEIAHNVLSRYKSLHALSQASIEDISSIHGISDQSAAFIKYLPQLAEFIFTDDAVFSDSEQLSHTSAATEYFRNKFENDSKGMVKLCCLTPSLHLIKTVNAYEGGISSSPDSIRKMIDIIIENRCYDVIIAFNHPCSHFVPTKQEQDTIGKIEELFSSLDVRLVDCVIVSEDNIPLSLSDSGYLETIRMKRRIK